MPHAVAWEPPPLDLDIALQVAEPPGEHRRADVFEDVVLDPELLTTIFEGLDSGTSRRDWLELPRDPELLRKMGGHCTTSCLTVAMVISRKRRSKTTPPRTAWVSCTSSRVQRASK